MIRSAIKRLDDQFWRFKALDGQAVVLEVAKQGSAFYARIASRHPAMASGLWCGRGATPAAAVKDCLRQLALMPAAPRARGRK